MELLAPVGGPGAFLRLIEIFWVFVLVCVFVCVCADAAVKTPVLLLVTRNMCQSRKIFAANFPRWDMANFRFSILPYVENFDGDVRDLLIL